MADPDTYRLNTTLQPVAAAVLAVLAIREDLKNGAANQVIERLLREELERLSPGLWDAAVHLANDSALATSSQAEKRGAVQALVSERLRARGGAR